MSQTAVAPPATIVIFGAMGDLARRLLVPALANLSRDGLLDPATTILGVNHGEGSDEGLRAALSEHLEADDAWAAMSPCIHYRQGDFTDAAVFERLAGEVTGNALFYLATAPRFFAAIVEALGGAGLLDEGDGFRRVVVEKPFGRDLASARELNRRLLAQAGERQLYRIDHFLGKETVQNILVARFGNPLFEAVWNSRYVDHVEITAAETVTVGSRGAFYDATGALRDMVPNHLFQLLAMVGMEPPNSFDADALRDEKAKLLSAVRPIDPADAVRGRYVAGRIGEVEVPDYRAEPDVAVDSRTETYAACRLWVDSWRWAGVPFYLRTGKALAARDTQVIVRFRDMPVALFRPDDVDHRAANRLILQIQPDEAITLDFAVKVPGPVLTTETVGLDFSYAGHFQVGHRTGYETLLYDALIGDQTLFQRADTIEAGWAAVQPLLEAWATGEPEDYPAGSDGPAGADALMARDGRRWAAIG